MKGLRRPKADKGVLEGLPPRIMSQKANGGGRSEGLRPGAAGYIRGSAPKKWIDNRAAINLHKKRPKAYAKGLFCGDKEIRTPDFLLAKQALYQLSYTPE